MTTTFIVELIKGGAPGWPRIEDDRHWTTVGSSRPLEDSWRIGNAELVRWMGQLHGLHLMDAYQLLSQVAAAPIAKWWTPITAWRSKHPSPCCPRRQPTTASIASFAGGPFGFSRRLRKDSPWTSNCPEAMSW